ncbi:G-type lectin S-receptor serine/threonine-protein kinase [Spatholobus suberectus]|nr:G-type lectin S-receptor serine/threonine-protein kinase [Spatholobus suberectus]
MCSTIVSFSSCIVVQVLVIELYQKLASVLASMKVHGQFNKLFLWEAVDKTVVENMVKVVALWCVQYEPVLCPTRKSVVLMSEGITDIATPPCPNSNSL